MFTCWQVYLFNLLRGFRGYLSFCSNNTGSKRITSSLLHEVTTSIINYQLPFQKKVVVGESAMNNWIFPRFCFNCWYENWNFISAKLTVYNKFKEIYWFLSEILLMIKESCNLIDQDHLRVITWVFLYKTTEFSPYSKLILISLSPSYHRKILLEYFKGVTR